MISPSRCCTNDNPWQLGSLATVISIHKKNPRGIGTTRAEVGLKE